jgi:hypothetical protein
MKTIKPMVPVHCKEWEPVLSFAASWLVGEPVNVEFSDLRESAGEAFCNKGMQIRLSQYLYLEAFEMIFAHEVGHHACRHFDPNDGLDREPTQTERRLAMLLEEGIITAATGKGQALTDEYRRHEQEADEMSIKLLSRFYSTFGPLSAFLT